MPNKSSEKKPSRRIRTVVEEVTPEPAPVVESTPEPVQPVEQVSSTPLVEPVPVEEKAKKILSELETVQTEDRKKKRRFSLKLLFVLTILIALVVGFVAGGFYVYTTGMSSINSEDTNSNNQSNTEPTTSATPTPSPSPSPEPVDVSEFSVSILNGSGKPGEASKVQALLEDAGFEVTSTGNASRFNFTDTVIQVKKDIPEQVVDQLEKALSETYSVEVGDVLSANASTDIVITVGSSAN